MWIVLQNRRRIVSRLALSLVAFCFVSAARATPVPLGDDPGAHYFTYYSPALALLPGGGYAAVWSWSAALDPEPGADVDARMQWVRPDGSLVFPQPGLNVAASRTQETAEAIVSDPAGGVFVAVLRGDLVRTRVLVQRFDAEGHRLWPGAGVIAADEPGKHLQLTPSLVPDGRGGVYVCLISLSDDGTFPQQSKVLCQHLSPEGRRLWLRKGIEPGGVAGLKSGPQAVTDGEGGVLVIWRNDRTANPDSGVRVVIEGQRFAANGSRLWGQRGRILQRTGLRGQQVIFIPQPLIAVSDGAGGAVLASQFRSGDDFDVVAQRVDRQGRALWGAGATVVSEPGFQHLDNLFAGPDGGAFVAVQKLGFRQDELSIYRLDGAGHTLWSVPVMAPEVNPAPIDVESFGDFDGDLLRVLWRHLPEYGSFRSEVRLVVLDLDGNRLNGPGGEALTDGATENVPRGFVYDPARGQGFAVWNANGFNGPAVGEIVDGN